MTGVFTNVLGTLLMFIITVYITRTFDTEIYGEFRLAFSFVSLIVVFFVFGRDNGVVYYSQELEAGEKQKLIIEECFYSLFTLSAGTFILYILGQFITDTVFSGNIELENYHLTLLMIPLWGFFNVGIAGLRAIGSINSSFTLTNFTQRALRALFFVVFAIFSHTFESLAWAMILSQLALIAILLYKLPFLLKVFNVKFFNFFKRFTYSFQLGLSSIIFVVLSRLDVMMLGNLSTNESVAIYDVCILLTLVILFPYTALVKSSEPVIKMMLKDNNVLRKYKANLKLAVILSLGVLIPFIIFPEFILSVFGAEYLKGDFSLMILSSGYALLVFLGSPVEILNMVGSVKISVRILLLSIIMNAVLNYLLIPQYGILGASIATIFSLLVTKILGSFILYKRHQLNIFQYQFFYIVIYFLIAIFIMEQVKTFLANLPKLYQVTIPLCLGYLFYFCLLWIFDKDLREKLCNVIKAH